MIVAKNKLDMSTKQLQEKIRTMYSPYSSTISSDKGEIVFSDFHAPKFYNYFIVETHTHTLLLTLRSNGCYREHPFFGYSISTGSLVDLGSRLLTEDMLDEAMVIKYLALNSKKIADVLKKVMSMQQVIMDELIKDSIEDKGWIDYFINNKKKNTAIPKKYINSNETQT